MLLIRWSDGQPLGTHAKSVHLEIESIDGLGTSPQPVLDSSGTYAARDLIPGRYRIAVHALGFLPVDTACQVSAGQVDTVVLMLDPAVAGTLHVRPAHDRYARVRPSGRSC